MPKCPLECKRTEYTVPISANGYHKFPTAAYGEFLEYRLATRTKYNPDDFSQSIRNNVLKVNIYYDSLSYIRFVEEPSIDMVALFSNIGGSLSLIVGIILGTIILFIRHKMTIHDWLNLKYFSNSFEGREM